jgi:hypothetical protein
VRAVAVRAVAAVVAVAKTSGAIAALWLPAARGHAQAGAHL